MADETTGTETEKAPDAQGRLADVLERLNQKLSEPAPAPSPQAPAASQQPQPVLYTTEQLQQFVDAGTLTQAQMIDRVRAQDAYLAEQRASQRDAQLTSRQQLLREIEKYQDARPALREAGSEDLKKVLARVQKLVAKGYDPNDLRTQVVALEMEYESPDGAKPAEETTRTRKASPERAGTSSGSKKESGEDGGNMPAARRLHFEKGIQAGRYKGWNDPQLRREAIRLQARDEEWGADKLRKELDRYPRKKAS